MNKVILIGNLAKKPELRNTTSGKQVATCSIATNKSFKDKNTGEKKSIVQFHNLVIWGPQASIFTTYLDKGSKVSIIGELQNRSYEDKTGNKKYITEVVVNEFEFLSKQESRSEVKETQPTEEEVDLEDIPF